MTEAPEPEDKLDATATVVVNGPEDATLAWHQTDWRQAEASVRRLRHREPSGLARAGCGESRSSGS